MVPKKNSDHVLTLRSATTKQLFLPDPKLQLLPRRKSRQRSQPSFPNFPHPCGSTVLLSPVRASWLSWLLWPCFTPTIITPVGPKSGSWQEESWHLNLHRSLRHDIKNTSQMHNYIYNCNYFSPTIVAIAYIRNYSLEMRKKL